MRIGLYFGSFNPVHIGHLIIASFIAARHCDRVWLVVTPQNPLKPAASLLNEYHRLHLTRLAVEGDPKLDVSDVEFHLPRPSYTIDTLTHLSERYPSNDFQVIVGSDSFLNIGNWKNAELLRKNYRFIVYERPGFPVREAPGVLVADAPLLDISSTLVRNMIQSGTMPRYLVPEQVLTEIERGGYYR